MNRYGDEYDNIKIMMKLMMMYYHVMMMLLSCNDNIQDSEE